MTAPRCAQGRVFWSQQASFVLACHTDLYHMPFDTQLCDYKQGLYALDASQVELDWRADEPALAAWDRQCLDEWLVVRLAQEQSEPLAST